MHYGRYVEPLAFSLDVHSVVKQDKCPLFSTIPKEIRDMIYEFALTDCTSNPANSDNKTRRGYGRDRNNRTPSSDIAFSLLRTCAAVYLEAYRLPLLLNPLISSDIHDGTRPKLGSLAPWQFALIQSLEVELQQAGLERGALREILEEWQANERHAGAYVAPRFYQQYKGTLCPTKYFEIVKASELVDGKCRDGDQVTLPDKSSLCFYDQSFLRVGLPARAMVARPLTRLTLRLSRTDWWTWTDDPNCTDGARQLGLDPACGTGWADAASRPTATQMLELAAQRREGNSIMRYTSTWGAEIAQLPDLKQLELVLETFGDKKHQLETVVDCAKTWRFPLDDTNCELVWDGLVETQNWSGGRTEFFSRDEAHNYDDSEDEWEDEEEEQGDEEMSDGEQINDEDEEAAVSGGSEEVEEDGEGDGEGDGDDGDSGMENDEENEEDGEETEGGIEDWVKRNKIFEVRIIRFKRTRV